MIGYVFIAFLVAYTGIYFLAYNLNYGYPYFSYVLSGILFVYLVAIPILTMRCFAEDKKNKTDQMLLTAPVSLFEIVLGKYLAMVTITAVPCVIYLIFPLIIKAQGTAYIKVDYLAILVFFLLGCVYISIGMFVSSLTESVIIAAISVCYQIFCKNFIVSQMLLGMQAGVGAVIAVVVYEMAGEVAKQKDAISWIIMAAAFLAATVFQVNVVYIVIASGLLGFLRSKYGKRKIS